MGKLTEDDIRKIEQIHSSWIQFEIAAESDRLAELCADDIELRPPDAHPVLGRTAVFAQLSRQTASIRDIEISDLRIRGSNEVAYLTSSFKTTLTSAENSRDKQILGSHLWVLEKRAGVWVVVAVTWSVWDRDAIAGTRSKPEEISSTIEARLKQARVARLATLDSEGRPRMVPVCFHYDGSFFYTAIDKKPKRVPPDKIARVRHIEAKPQVALLIDEYDDDWTKLWFVLVRGTAKLIPESESAERAKVIRELKQKYPQYAAGMLSDDPPIIRVTPEQVTSWGQF